MPFGAALSRMITRIRLISITKEATQKKHHVWIKCKNITLTLNTPQLCQRRVCKQDFEIKGDHFKYKGQTVKMTL